jgi:hypothetical protein
MAHFSISLGSFLGLWRGIDADQTVNLLREHLREYIFNLAHVCPICLLALSVSVKPVDCPPNLDIAKINPIYTGAISKTGHACTLSRSTFH